MKKLQIILLLIAVILLGSCYDSTTNGDQGAIDKTDKLKGDSCIYGLACDGSSDSIVVLLPNEGGDPIRYNIIRAMKNHQVFGEPQIGDDLAILVNPKNKREALMVIDLDMMKATWTFQVIPKLKKSATKTEEQIMAEMTDSMKQVYFVPREYGFTLKSHYQASPVGRIITTNSLEDDSPVEYPKVTNYTSWHIYNGRLILFTDTLDAKGNRIPHDSVKYDEGTMVFLSNDSMAAKFNVKVMQYHRKNSASDANKAAQQAANKASEKSVNTLTK